jgi:hypothetical protein
VLRSLLSVLPTYGRDGASKRGVGLAGGSRGGFLSLDAVTGQEARKELLSKELLSFVFRVLP